MCHIHQSLRAHSFRQESENPWTPDRGLYTDPPCTQVGGANATTAGCKTTARLRTATTQDQTHRRNWQCVNTVKNTIITTPYPLFFVSVFWGFFSGVGGGDGEGASPGVSRLTPLLAPRLYVAWQDAEKTRQGHCEPEIWQTNTPEKSCWRLLSSVQYLTYDLQGAKPGITTEGGP